MMKFDGGHGEVVFSWLRKKLEIGCQGRKNRRFAYGFCLCQMSQRLRRGWSREMELASGWFVLGEGY